MLRSITLLLALSGLGACSEHESPLSPAAAGAPGAGSPAIGAGMTGSAGATSAPTAATGGAPAAGATGSGTAGTAGQVPEAGAGPVAGSTEAGAGGTTGAGNGGSGGAQAVAGCTRELLKSTIDAYFVALAAHDASSLALADGVKLTENGEVIEVGQGLWTSAGAVKHTQSALDTEVCSSATHAVVAEGSMDIPLALRLRLEGAQITEIEMIAVRPGDYRVFGSDFPSDPDAIIAADAEVQWETPVPAAQRNTREEIAGWIDKYFRAFPAGVCDVTSDCTRLENGGGSFDCTLGASCAAGEPSGQAVLEPRLILVDDEAGIGVGFTLFMGNTDMHMYKMYGSQIHAVHAILGAASSSGW